MRTTMIAAVGAMLVAGAVPMVYATPSAPSAQAMPPAHTCNPVPIPQLGINADCGQAAAQCGLSAITGVGSCAGAPANLPTVQQPQLGPATVPSQANLAPWAQVPSFVPLVPNTGPQNQPGQQCSDPAFYATHSLSCPTMPGFTGPPPGMGPGQPNDPGVVGP
jgi:hypothetical protein